MEHNHVNRHEAISQFKSKIYAEYTNEELKKEQPSKFVFDIECFPNYFLIAFKNINNGKIIKLHKKESEEIYINKLRWIIDHHFLIGFNSNNYDLVMLSAVLHGKSLTELKHISNLIIEDCQLRTIEDTFSFKRLIFNEHLDISDITPNQPSLKLLGARLNAPRIQDLPYEHDKILSDEECLIVDDYCINDLDLTELLYNSLSPQLELRRKLTYKYGINLNDKSDSKIAERILKKELEKNTGHEIKAPKVEQNSIFRYNNPGYLSFTNPEFKTFLEKCENAEFKLDSKGHLVNRELKEVTINSKYRHYTAGLGGLHSVERNQSLKSNDTYSIIDIDAASFYPAIILNLKLYPEHIGPEFLVTYVGLVNARLKAKKEKDTITAEGLKITINASFGKFACQHSILYSPQLMLQTTLTGQLSLFMLIDRLEQENIKVFSANTDGIIIKVSKEEENAASKIINKWERDINFKTEQTRYKAIYSANVNNYIAVKHDNTIKYKGWFSDPFRQDLSLILKKNSPNSIITLAISELIINNIPIEITIKNCKDITQFLSVRKVTNGAHQDGMFLGKITRWYKATNTLSSINYISNDHLVPKSGGSRSLMEIGDFPQDIDYKWYINETNKMLWEIGYYQNPTLFDVNDY
jgi:hypothetical protein